MPVELCHVTTAQALEAAGDRIEAEPFLHCCTEAQLAFVLRQHFAAQTGLVVLRFDPAVVEGRIVWEQSEPDQDPFPHLYGALPVAGVRVSAISGVTVVGLAVLGRGP